MRQIQKILNNGIKIPSIGFGTYKSGSNEETEKIVTCLRSWI